MTEERRDEASAADEDLRSLIDSAARLGVEVDEAEALQWLSAMAAPSGGGDVVVDTRSGVFGHRVTMLDFSDEELERFRAIGRIVDIPSRPGVESALALSGSAAQSKIQTYPGDCDYFERVNIKADDRDTATAILAEVMRDKALETAEGDGYRLIEVKFGSYPTDVVHRGRAAAAGAPISWSVEEIRSGRLDATDPAGEPVEVLWEVVASDPGWCKLDWIVTDPIRNQLANASNMLDATWEAPDGSVVPLDGFLDPYYQEIYLDAESLPVFSKLVNNLEADAVDEYVEQLEHEVAKYTSGEPNYGKAAKRMYNVFRLTGRYAEAAYIRELFDEPATLLYQVSALLRTLDDAVTSGDRASSVTGQLDEITLTLVDVLEGDEEHDAVASMLRLRDSLAGGESGWSEEVERAREDAMAVVNAFFEARLMSVPGIAEYLEDVAAS